MIKRLYFYSVAVFVRFLDSPAQFLKSAEMK
jgi:hypothetical protein